MVPKIYFKSIAVVANNFVCLSLARPDVEPNQQHVYQRENRNTILIEPSNHLVFAIRRLQAHRSESSLEFFMLPQSTVGVVAPKRSLKLEPPQPLPLRGHSADHQRHVSGQQIRCLYRLSHPCTSI